MIDGFYTVSRRANTYKQPRGGFIKFKSFNQIRFEGNAELLSPVLEPANPSIVGLAVDYLTRYMLGVPKEEAFKISLRGVEIAQKMEDQQEKRYYNSLSVFQKMKYKFKNRKKDNANRIINMGNKMLSQINGLDIDSIQSVCELVTFDVFYRNPMHARITCYDMSTFVEENECINIRTMVQRSLKFFEEYGPVTATDFTFDGGYTSTVFNGDGDYLTKDCLWDMKVSKNKITPKHSLQILMYWIMGQHFGQEIFKSITKIGVFNPKLNMAFQIDIKDIPPEVIKEVEREVIGYEA